MGINSFDVFSAIHETDDMNELVESVGEGGPEGICNELILLRFKRLGAI